MFNRRISNSNVITGFSFGAMFFLGLGVTIIGAAAQNAGISPSQVGVLVTVQNIGFLLSVALSGRLADRYSMPRVLAVGSVILASGFAGFYLRETFWINGVFMFLVGVGVGTYEGVTDALIIVLHPRRKSYFVNVNHFFVTLGALLITLYLIFLQMAWRLSMTQAATMVALLALLFTFSEVTRGETADEDNAGPGGGDAAKSDAAKSDTAERVVRPGDMFRHSPALLLLLFAMICAVGLELGSISLLTTYLVEVRGFNEVTSKVGLLLFIGGIGLGRTALASFIQDQTVERWVLGFFILAIVAMVLLFTIPSAPLLYLLTPVAGLTVSVLLPSIIVLAGKWFPNQAGTAIGLVKVGIPLGGIVLPMLVAVATQVLPFQTALYVFPLTAALGGVTVAYFVLPGKPQLRVE